MGVVCKYSFLKQKGPIMTLHEVNLFREDYRSQSETESTAAKTPEIKKPADSDETYNFFSPFVLHDNYKGIPDIDSDPYEQFLQERVVFPANLTGKLALKLFKEGIEFGEDKCRQDGENPENFTYWVRLLTDDSEEGYSLEFGLRGGSERPTVQGIMARCAIENGLPCRDTSESSLTAFVLELSMYEDKNLS